MKIRVETAQKMKVWPALEGPRIQAERALPHHQHHADGEQHAGEPVEQALSHGVIGAYLNYT